MSVFNSLATPFVPYLTLDGAPDIDTCSSLLSNGIDTQSADILFDDQREAGDPNDNTARFRQLAKTKRSLRRSNSDAIVASRTPTLDLSVISEEVAAQKLEDGHGISFQEQAQASLNLQRPTTQRASSSSHVERTSRYHDPNITSATLQQELIAQTRQGGKRPVRSVRAQPVPDTENSAPRFKWFMRSRSNSNPDVSRALARPKREPLKPCMKTSKSTTTTPPNGLVQTLVHDDDNRMLRRVKTVDFEETTSKALLASAPRTPPTQDLLGKVADQAMKVHLHATNSKKEKSHRAPCCPILMTEAKGTAADPAFTRANVHVIAIAPSWKLDTPADEGIVDPATPTMQIVESGNNCYEVVWDDVPGEHKIQLRQRRSSASHSLSAVSSTATRGLQRVNTKLTDWSGSWNSLSESFKPTIVVFPDDDGRQPQYECAVEDDEDFKILAPPNSQMTSASTSRLPSRPASAPLTREASHEEIGLEDALREGPPQDNPDWTSPFEQPRAVPDPEAHPVRVGTSRRLRQLEATRKLSNVEEDGLRFRGHRDSVTVAHSRLLHTGGVSPDLFAHRDSISMAKKRMHAKNHAKFVARDAAPKEIDSVPSVTRDVPPVDEVVPAPSVAHDISLADEVVMVPLAAHDVPPADEAVPVPSASPEEGSLSLMSWATAKEDATQALQTRATESILAPQQPPTQRHIRIVD